MVVYNCYPEVIWANLHAVPPACKLAICGAVGKTRGDSGQFWADTQPRFARVRGEPGRFSVQKGGARGNGPVARAAAAEAVAAGGPGVRQPTAAVGILHRAVQL